MPRFKPAILVISGSLLLAASLWAQVDRGTVTGIVTDQSGAVVPNVQITVTNITNGVTNTATTNASGVYSIPQLPAAEYRLSAAAKGFRHYEQSGIIVNVGQTARLDVSLIVGQTTQTVQVTSQAASLERETSDTATTVSNQELEELPLISEGDQRSPADFLQLAPGVTGRGPSNNNSEGYSRTMSTQVSGSMVASTTMMIDGADLLTDAGFEGDLRALQIPPDAVAESKLEATNGSAEYGRSAGGTADFEIKSGTNQIHGSAYEFVRNNAFNAIPFFENAGPPGCNSNGEPITGTEVGVKQCQVPYKQNEFGVTGGAPIKKDKAFVFGWYDGFRLVQGVSTGTSQVPTNQMKAGDFTQWLQLPVPQVLYDPTTHTTCGPIICGNKFLSTSDFSAISTKILPYFPAANVNQGPGASATAALTSNYFSSVANPETINMYGFKGDYVFNDKNRMSGVYDYGNNTTPNIASIPAPLGGGDQPSYNKTRNVRLNYNLIVRPNLLNNAVLAYNFWGSGTEHTSTYGGKSDWVDYLGLKGFDPTFKTEFPQIVIGANGESFNGGGGESVSDENSEEVEDTLTWIEGKHTLKFGFEYIKNALNTVSTGRSAGWFEFAQSTVGIPSDPSSGVGFASFLLGDTDRTQSYVYTQPGYDRSGYYAGFAQDDFKFSRKLTFNLGIRWDLFEPDIHKNGTKSWEDPTIPNPGAPGEYGAMAYGFSSQYPSGVKTHYHNFAPRVGLAYALNDKTVVRAAYGIFFAQGNANRLDGSTYVQGYNLSPTIGTINQQAVAFNWDQDTFPTFTPSLTPTVENGLGPYMTDPSDGVAPYAENIQIQVQRQLPGQIMLSTGYVENTGVHLASLLMPTTQMPPQYLPLGNIMDCNGAVCPANVPAGVTPVPLLNAPISDPLAQQYLAGQPIDPATGHHSPFPGFEALWAADNPSNLILGKALSINPQYNSLDRGYEGVATSTYNALQIKADKRFSNGLTLLASYAWSKTLTNGGQIFGVFSSEFGSDDPWNAHSQKAYSFEDMPDILSIAYVYELPVGLGKKFLNRGGVVNQVLGGWKVSGVNQYQSGRPQNIEAPVTSGGLEQMDGFNTPDVVPGVPLASAADRSGHFDPNTDIQFNVAAFKFPCQFCFGSLTPTEATVRSFGYFDEDFSLMKAWTIQERFNLEFRADVLNLLNRVELNASGGNQGAYADEPELGTSGFGVLNNQNNWPRAIQFGMRLKW
jgi:hypothetical protein